MTQDKPKLLELPTDVTATDGAAPHVRRFLAFAFDLAFSTVLAVVAVALIHFAQPSQTPTWLVGSVVVGSLLGVIYLGFSPLLLGNTLGKWLFSLQLVSERHAALSTGSLFKRLLLTGLWPINAIVVLSRRSRTHFGDSWARTRVVLSSRVRNPWLALGLATLTLIGVAKLGSGAALLAIVRSDAWQAARTELGREPGAAAPTFPSSFSMLGDLASFDADVGTGVRRIVVARSRDGSHWNLVSSIPVVD